MLSSAKKWRIWVILRWIQRFKSYLNASEDSRDRNQTIDSKHFLFGVARRRTPSGKVRMRAIQLHFHHGTNNSNFRLLPRRFEGETIALRTVLGNKVKKFAKKGNGDNSTFGIIQKGVPRLSGLVASRSLLLIRLESEKRKIVRFPNGQEWTQIGFNRNSYSKTQSIISRKPWCRVVPWGSAYLPIRLNVALFARKFERILLLPFESDNIPNFQYSILLQSHIVLLPSFLNPIFTKTALCSKHCETSHVISIFTRARV